MLHLMHMFHLRVFLDEPIRGVTDTNPSAFARRLRPWFVVFLVLEVVLLVLRLRMGNAHGALLMFAVIIVGVLALSVGFGGIDTAYGGYFGLMSFVSGLLDLNLAIEFLVWNPALWTDIRHEHPRKDIWEDLARPALFLACSTVQLASAAVSYMVFKEAEVFGLGDMDLPFATQEQARVYNAVINHADAVRDIEEAGSSSPAAAASIKAFAGRGQKLP